MVPWKLGFSENFDQVFISLPVWLLHVSFHLKADLDGTIFAYHYCAWLAYVMTFEHSTREQFFDMICREVMTHARAQDSHK